MKVKRLFFDNEKIIRSVDTATRKVLSRFGAFVRRTAKGSIRKRKKTSAPGQPPTSHTGFLKRFIFFSFEPNRKSVVIGPMRLNQKTADAPHVLEYGGTATIKDEKVNIRPRPYMGPAFNKEKQKLPQLWKNAIK